MKAFSETINTDFTDPTESIPVASSPTDFEDKVNLVMIRMKELGYEPSVMQVRNFVRKIRKVGDLTEFIGQMTGQKDPLAPFSEKVSAGVDPKQWQKLLEDIKRWKKIGGTLKAKLEGKEGKEIRRRIEELVARRGPKLTSGEMDEIAATPGIIPPWWSKDTEYDRAAIKAITKLGVSATDVHIAVERAYTDKPLNKIQKEILKVGWGARK